MIVDVVVPAAGESVKEGDIARWFFEDGDWVELDELLLEMETDKASLEVPAKATGRLAIKEHEGATVEVGQVIGTIDTDAPAPSHDDEDDEAEATAGDAAAAPEDDGESREAEESEGEAAPVEHPTARAAEGMDAHHKAEDRAKHDTVFNLMMPSPAARKLIAENNLSAKDIKGTGRDGRITKADVLEYLDGLEREEAAMHRAPDELQPRPKVEPPKPEPGDQHPLGLESSSTVPAQEPARGKHKTEAPAEKPAAKPAQIAAGNRDVRRERMTRIRRTIADRLLKSSREMAMLATFNEVDMGAIKAIRAEYKEPFKKKHEVGLGFMSFFTKAVCLALREFPAINAQIDDEEIVYHDYCDIGIAVSTPRGLLVPVIRDAETLSFHEIEAAIVDLATRGRDGKIGLDELAGGTFTITNGGIFGSMLSTPLVNYPQSGILGMHNIVDRPVARDGQVVIRPVMYVALSYDHRIVDGQQAVRFLVRVKEALEDPVRLLLDV